MMPEKRGTGKRGLKRRIVGWSEIYARLHACPEGSVWGIPRGGAIVAGLTWRAVECVEDADVIVDDILDSGKTMREWKEKWPKKKFWVLVDKKAEMIGEDVWVVFPWESEKEFGRRQGT